jgi:hypothetical protein
MEFSTFSAFECRRDVRVVIERLGFEKMDRDGAVR